MNLRQRFGTFINISLGVGSMALVEAMRDQPWSGPVLTTAALSLLIGFSIWWGFFDALDQAPMVEVREHNRNAPYEIWIFAHIRLRQGRRGGHRRRESDREANVSELEDSVRWFICGMVTLCYLAHAVVHVAYAKAGARGSSSRGRFQQSPPRCCSGCWAGAFPRSSLRACSPRRRARRSCGTSGTERRPMRATATILFGPQARLISVSIQSGADSWEIFRPRLPAG